MMFQDEYSKQLDSIRADGYIKQKIRLKFEQDKTKKQNKPKANIIIPSNIL